MLRFLAIALLGGAISTLATGQVPSDTTWVRVVHASADAPAVDVLANGSLVFQGLNFKDYTDYTPVPPSTYKFQVNLTGTSTTVLSSGTVTLQGGRAYTFYALGRVAAKNLVLLGAGDNVTPPAAGSTKIRIVHGASSAPAVDIYATNPYAP